MIHRTSDWNTHQAWLARDHQERSRARAAPTGQTNRRTRGNANSNRPAQQDNDMNESERNDNNGMPRRILAPETAKPSRHVKMAVQEEGRHAHKTTAVPISERQSVPVKAVRDTIQGQSDLDVAGCLQGMSLSPPARGVQWTAGDMDTVSARDPIVIGKFEPPIPSGCDVISPNKFIGIDSDPPLPLKQYIGHDNIETSPARQCHSTSRHGNSILIESTPGNHIDDQSNQRAGRQNRSTDGLQFDTPPHDGRTLVGAVGPVDNCTIYPLMQNTMDDISMGVEQVRPDRDLYVCPL